MKVGDYVAKKKDIFPLPHEKPEPLGVVVCSSASRGGLRGFWDVLMSCGGVESFNENWLEVINESR